MADSQSIARFLNPWALHLQKLGLELKCPICLKLLDKPVLLPCNHIFCNSCVPECTQYESECLVCNHQFINQDIRPAPYIENIVSIYRTMDSALSAVSPSLSAIGRSFQQSPMSVSSAQGQSPSKICNVKSDIREKCEMRPCSVDKKVDGKPSAEEDVNRLPQHSPASYITSDDNKEADANTCQKEYQNLGFRKTTANMSSVDAQHVNTSETKCRSREDDDDESLERDNKRHKKSNSQSDVVSDSSLPVCAFCKSSSATDASGPVVFYTHGKEGVESLPDSIPVHRRCIDWAPQIYYEGDIIKNFKSELTRSAKLKCNECGQKGAALGCYMKSCPKTYHPPCAFESEECRWDMDNFLMLCPSHTSARFPTEKPKSRKSSIVGSHKKSKLSTKQSNFWSTSPDGQKEWVLCGSALSPEDKCTLVEFGKMCGATVSKLWTSNVTHVIAAVDSEGACARTLKVLMAILGGKWIISMDWVRACLEANCHVNEEPYEINLDNHGCCDGPKNGRLRASTDAPKLFESLRFYPSGDFVGPFLKDLLELVKVAGGTVVERKEDLIDAKGQNCLIVYNCDPLRVSMPDAERSIVPKRLEEAEDLAKQSGSLVIKHTWILESIAACDLVPFV
ncbi:unnamed protein product [Cuscuta campestris]|uniref:RING-type E3 ubiquitin transferase BRCA1 n=1 Tax=Cuscuta campestris TaxID=132261 RepID=A0A484MCD7_9ASTE|nr:unnamed protein product [Cuscuta campestris]